MSNYVMKPVHGILAIGLLMFNSASSVADTPQPSIQPLTAGMTNKQQALLSHLQPSARAWIDQEARLLAETKTLDDEVLRSAIRARFMPTQSKVIRKANGPTTSANANAIASLGTGSDLDVEAVAFIVLMGATADMDSDLKSIMAEVKSMDNAKQKLRALVSTVNADVAAHAGEGNNQPCASPLPKTTTRSLSSAVCGQYSSLHSEAAYALKQVPHAGTLPPAAISSVGDLRAMLSRSKDKLDSLNEMSEATSLRLQMTMDRRSKFISALSNVMKKISTTSDSIVQNLK